MYIRLLPFLCTAASRPRNGCRGSPTVSSHNFKPQISTWGFQIPCPNTLSYASNRSRIVVFVTPGDACMREFKAPGSGRAVEA